MSLIVPYLQRNVKNSCANIRSYRTSCIALINKLETLGSVVDGVLAWAKDLQKHRTVLVIDDTVKTFHRGNKTKGNSQKQLLFYAKR